MRRPGHGQNKVLILEFRTEGFAVAPRCVSHPDSSTVRHVWDHEAFGRGKRVHVCQLEVDVSHQPEGKPFRLVAHALYWNGFQGPEQWAAAYFVQAPHEAEIAIKRRNFDRMLSALAADPTASGWTPGS